jgi:hypothetical protein
MTNNCVKPRLMRRFRSTLLKDDDDGIDTIRHYIVRICALLGG